MLFDHLPKINIALGTLALLCFFLPWVSFDCGDINLLKLSGFELATGRLPVDSDLLRQASASIGADTSAVAAFEQNPRARPQIHLFLILICAAAVVGFGVRMFDEAERTGIYGSGVLSILGMMLLVFTAASQFGSAIPPDVAAFVKSSLQIGFYGTCVSFLGVIALALFWIKEDAGWTFRKTPAMVSDASEAPVTLEAMEKPAPMAEQLGTDPAVKPEENTGEHELNILEIPEPPKIDPVQTEPPPAPPGAKTCPSCGVVVGPYQVKCMKCGAKLKVRT